MKYFVIVALLIVTTGCATHDSRILQGGNQLELRNMQSRSFDTTDKQLVVRNVISTLQDLGFVIDKADAELGTVSATKLSGYTIRMTTTVRKKDSESVVVRASGQYNLKTISDPVMYQDFFTGLSKSIFLAANTVE